MLRGKKGEKWLNDLPKLIRKYEEQWDLKILSPFILSYNYVAPAKTKTGEDIVFKLSFPHNDEFPKEVKALELFNGEGAVRVLRKDLENGAVLLERPEPGSRLRETGSDIKQVSVAAAVMKKIHKPTPKGFDNFFPTIADWAKAFDRYRDRFSKNEGPVPRRMFDKAEAIFKNSKNQNYLLHGDIHSDNILLSQRGWLLIDPKGVIGEKEFELGAFLRNPIYDCPRGSNYKEVTKNRITQFSQELGFDKKRILEWAFACAVISILWFLEDQKEVKDIYLQNAELINGIHV